MTGIRKTRTTKIHPWVDPKILRRFETVRIKHGYSRDGALEKAMQLFIDADALTRANGRSNA